MSRHAGISSYSSIAGESGHLLLEGRQDGFIAFAKKIAYWHIAVGLVCKWGYKGRQGMMDQCIHAFRGSFVVEIIIKMKSWIIRLCCVALSQ